MSGIIIKDVNDSGKKESRLAIVNRAGSIFLFEETSEKHIGGHTFVKGYQTDAFMTPKGIKKSDQYYANFDFLPPFDSIDDIGTTEYWIPMMDIAMIVEIEIKM